MPRLPRKVRMRPRDVGSWRPQPRSTPNRSVSRCSGHRVGSERIGCNPREPFKTEVFLIAMTLIFAVPYLVWRFGRTDYYAPLVVVQTVVGILLGPGVLGSIYPSYYESVFTPTVVQSLNGIAWWAVVLYVWIAGIELDLAQTWRHRRESGTTAVLALGVPLLM